MVSTGGAIDALIKLGRIDDGKVLEQVRQLVYRVMLLQSWRAGYGSGKVEQSDIDNLINLYSAGNLAKLYQWAPL